jgi:hypothetical protein
MQVPDVLAGARRTGASRLPPSAHPAGGSHGLRPQRHLSTIRADALLASSPANAPLSSRGLGRRPLMPETRVRIPVAVLRKPPRHRGFSRFGGCSRCGDLTGEPLAVASEALLPGDRLVFRCGARVRLDGRRLAVWPAARTGGATRPRRTSSRRALVRSCTRWREQPAGQYRQSRPASSEGCSGRRAAPRDR